MIIGLLVIGELLALIWLASTVSTYKNFWQQKAKQPGEITYLALGDSAAQGIGATSPSRGYVGLIAERMQKYANKNVRIINLSKTGAKMGDYLSEQAPQIRYIKADLVTIEIGANDVAAFDPNKYRLDFKQVLASLPEGAYVANMPVFNSRPLSTDKARQASKIIKEELKSYSKLHFVDLQQQTTEHQSIFGFAPDLFHPNDFSYVNWADAFWINIQKYKRIDKI
ncbi:SGNH/GDSL hydrolase family protein [Candidatus Saccharibacteria bacterium]|nr:SGNH/GDSL hydrolase family protein [Candidatus Saccharibacteria bacterium]